MVWITLNLLLTSSTVKKNMKSKPFSPIRETKKENATSSCHGRVTPLLITHGYPKKKWAMPRKFWKPIKTAFKSLDSSLTKELKSCLPHNHPNLPLKPTARSLNFIINELSLNWPFFLSLALFP
jgi:hypothetical protein